MGEMDLCINVGSGFAFVAEDCGHRDEIIATPRIGFMNGGHLSESLTPYLVQIGLYLMWVTILCAYFTPYSKKVGTYCFWSVHKDSTYALLN
jgi:hypothetical protein